MGYQLLGTVDATLLEVNPFGETDCGRVVCFDAKLNFDDNAAFRQKRVFGMDDMSESDPREVQAAQFNLLLADEQVESVLVNIFGGIVNCATIANGITAAAKSIDLRVPLVVRLEGTNVDAAKRIMAESGLPIISAEDLDDAAQKAVASLKK